MKTIGKKLRTSIPSINFQLDVPFTEKRQWSLRFSYQLLSYESKNPLILNVQKTPLVCFILKIKLTWVDNNHVNFNT